nr:uncharacterized protein CI109_007218 [Kwoniella shandongensis]KAA5524468.1 hypothetical protein CI109_007218 [Kwoniella shandongensis]
MTASSVKITGPEPKTFQMKGDKGGTMTRAWCDGCGSGLWIRPEAIPNFLGVKAGLFDAFDIPNPTIELYTRNMCPWETTCATAKQFEGGMQAAPSA